MENFFYNTIIKVVNKQIAAVIGILILGNFAANCQQLFTQVDASASKIDFVNEVNDTKDLNILNYAYYYNGAGVQVLDYNKDGLMDLYFVANIGNNKLYKNKGNFLFEEVTIKASLQASEGYKTAATIVDINNDGWDDIYVCRSLNEYSTIRKNYLFVNNKDGTFTEKAKEYNLNLDGWTYQTYFVDIDKDGDLDCFQINQLPNPGHTIMKFDKQRNKDGELIPVNYLPIEKYSNQLFENRNGKFINVTKQSGLATTTFGLSALFEDFNNDGLVDIYTSNDFTEPDYLYINKGNNQFEKTLEKYTAHSSLSSMGSDIEDLNNDLLPDMIVLDMLPENNFRMKELRNMNNYDSYNDLVKYGFGHQFAKNVLQKNNGDGTFSDISYYANVAHSDWSWAPIIADFDNDGLKDIFISNGIMRDVTNQDFVKFKADSILKVMSNYLLTDDHIVDMLNEIPSYKVANCLYKNNGDFNFKNIAKECGLGLPTWSSGSAIADLDNDGDLDLIINNTNDTALLYKNLSVEKKINNFVQFTLIGPAQNLNAVGTECIIYYNGQVQRQKLFTNKGFISSHHALVHFGLGTNTQVDSMLINWPNNMCSVVKNFTINSTQTINYQSIKKAPFNHVLKTATPYLVNTANMKGLDVMCKENDYVDFKLEPLLPHQFSYLGPCVEVDDINNDGLQDVYVGGAKGQSAKIFLQNNVGNFTQMPQPDLEKDAMYEDGAAVFVDINEDGFKDILVACGGNDYGRDSNMYPVRLYINNAKGSYNKSKLPQELYGSFSSISVSKNKIICWARVSPGNYGKKPTHIILEMKNKNIVVAKSANNTIQNLGMVANATTINAAEIALAGEWMPITIAENKNETLAIKTQIPFSNGWWNCITPCDVDNDGDIDFVCGNQGLNTSYSTDSIHPIMMNAFDFDANGNTDAIISVYSNGNYYPTTIRDYICDQMPILRKKYVRYKNFAYTTTANIFESELMNKSEVYQAYTFRSGTYINNKGAFTFVPFEWQAQLFPINDIATQDFNKDGNLDLLMIGNNYHSEIESGRDDAGKGLILLGKGNGQFYLDKNYNVSINGDAKKIRKIKIGERTYYIVGINNDKLQLLSTQ